MDYNDKLKHIINHFGIDNQLNKLKEEVNELIEAIEEYEANRTITNYKHIVEEFGDVAVVLNQIKINYTISDENIVKIGRIKVDRTMNRIVEGYYE